MNTDINEWQDYILYINWLNSNVLTFNDYMEQMQSYLFSILYILNEMSNIVHKCLQENERESCKWSQHQSQLTLCTADM